ncbi:hypothetical protein BJ165DRAFT_1520536 [Panaeolus papilionaceus]|nr:hypothetical protein BJ165DRAFT_1520536 [Panaeolus papilionaceus]
MNNNVVRTSRLKYPVLNFTLTSFDQVNSKFKFYLLDTNNNPTMFIRIATGVHEMVQGPKIYFPFGDGTYDWFIYKTAEDLFPDCLNNPPGTFGKAELRLIPASGDANAPMTLFNMNIGSSLTRKSLSHWGSPGGSDYPRSQYISRIYIRPALPCIDKSLVVV